MRLAGNLLSMPKTEDTRTCASWVGSLPSFLPAGSPETSRDLMEVLFFASDPQGTGQLPQLPGPYTLTLLDRNLRLCLRQDGAVDSRQTAWLLVQGKLPYFLSKCILCLCDLEKAIHVLYTLVSPSMKWDLFHVL